MTDSGYASKFHSSAVVRAALDENGELHLNATLAEALLRLIEIDEKQLVGACITVDELRQHIATLQAAIDRQRQG